ncbi:hypothetical protein [Legionella sp.]|uniref:hypothetical protein n=1 Tax=Legionella sp. TaxID=459 RepID=UPI00257D26A5|nr:hypothetical protein [Legionella sp.]
MTQKIQASLFPRFNYQELIVSHPSMYNFIIEVIDLLDRLPAELNDTVSFLNPQAFTIDIKNSSLASLLPSNLDFLKVVVEHAPKLVEEQSNSTNEVTHDSTGFSYKVTNQDGEIDSLSIEDIFDQSIPTVISTLFAALNSYLHNYSETTHVKSEIAKAEWLQKFTRMEKNSAKRCLSEAKQLEMDFAEFKCSLEAESHSDKKVELLDKQIKGLAQSIEQLVDLANRNKNYEKQDVATLFGLYPELISNLQKDQRAGLDTSYMEDQLPEVIIARNRLLQFAVIPIKDALIFGPSQYSEIERLINSLKEKRKELVMQCEQEAKTWEIQVSDFHVRENERIDKELINYIKKTSELSESFEDNFENLKIDARFEFIAKQKNSVSLDLGRAREYLSAVQKLKKEILNNTAQLSRLLLEIEPKIAVQTAACYQSSRERAEQALVLLQRKITTLELRQKALEIQYNKAKSAQELSETMKSSDPSLFIELIESKIAGQVLQIEELKKKREQLLIKEKQKADLIKGKNTEAIRTPEALIAYQDKLRLQKDRFATQRTELIDALKFCTKTGANPETILSDENLSTHLGIQSAFDYMDSFIREYRQESKESRDKTFDQNMLQALEAAQEQITNTKGKINFSALDKKIKAILKSKRDRGFDVLLDNLQSHYHTKERWANYRNKEANDIEVIENTDLLLTFLTSHIVIYKMRIADRPKLLAFQDNENELSLLLALIDSIRVLNRNIEELSREHEQDCARKEKVFNDKAQLLEDEIRVLNPEVRVSEKELEGLTKEINILDTIIKLLKGHQLLSKEITELENQVSSLDAEALNLNQAKLMSGFDLANLKLQQLEDLLKAVDNLTDNTAYQDKINNIKKLLADSKRKIAQIIIENSCRKGLNDLQNQVAQGNEKLNAISLALDVKPEDEKLTQANQLIRLNSKFNQSTDLVQFVSAYLTRIPLLGTNLKMLDNKELKIEIEATIEHFNQLDKICRSQNSQCLEEIQSLLQVIRSELEQNKTKADVKFDENKTTYELNVIHLNEVDNYLTKFPSCELNQLKSSLDELGFGNEITNILASYEDLKQQMQNKNRVNSDLGKRVKARVEFATRFTTELTGYVIKRKSFKDRLFSHDAQARESFIERINLALDSYTKSGDSNAISTIIQEKKESFGGFKLRSILNCLLVELNEFDRTIPREYQAELDTIAVVNHDLALDYLEDINIPELTERMNKLYQEISKLHQFGDTILKDYEEQGNVAKNLAIALQTKADRFIIDNKDEFNKPELPLENRQFFLDFYADFRCHIHSKDNVMSQHTSWLPLIANLGLAALAILSLGIAIPVKRAVTELMVGKSVFFCRTDGLEHVDNIEQVISKNRAASAA